MVAATTPDGGGKGPSLVFMQVQLFQAQVAVQTVHPCYAVVVQPKDGNIYLQGAVRYSNDEGHSASRERRQRDLKIRERSDTRRRVETHHPLESFDKIDTCGSAHD